MLTRFKFARTLKLVPIVFQCERCPRFHTVSVAFEENAEPVVQNLARTCSCGEALDVPWINRDVIGTARMLVETAHARRRA